MEDLSLFEEALADYIKHWQETKKDPLSNIEDLRCDANELAGDILDSIPCWQKQDIIKENGLFKVKNGTALVHNGYFVMLEDLVERLPRIID